MGWESPRVVGVSADLRITVDHDRCVGSEMCIVLAEGVFAINENGQSIVVDPTAADRDQILEAAEQCPTEAISVHDAATGESLYPEE